VAAYLTQPEFHEKLRSLDFEVIANGPDGLRRRIAEEVPCFRDLIAKAGIARVQPSPKGAIALAP